VENKQRFKSSCKLQLGKSLTYQLCQLGGDAKGQISDRLCFLLSFPSSLRQDAGSWIVGLTVTVTFLFLLIIAHLGANGLQININSDSHGEAEIFTSIADVPFKSSPLSDTEDRELHRSKGLKVHFSIYITLSCCLHHREGNKYLLPSPFLATRDPTSLRSVFQHARTRMLVGTAQYRHVQQELICR